MLRPADHVGQSQPVGAWRPRFAGMALGTELSLVCLACIGAFASVWLLLTLSRTFCVPIADLAGLERRTGLTFPPGSTLEQGYYAVKADVFVYAVIRSPSPMRAPPDGHPFEGQDPAGIGPAWLDLPALPDPRASGLNGEARQTEWRVGSFASGSVERCLAWEFTDTGPGETVTYVHWTLER